ADLRVRCASRGSLARICVNCDAVAYAATRRPRMQADLRRCIRRAAETGAITFGREPDHLDDLIRIQLRFNGPFRYASEFELGASTASWAAFTEALLRRLAATGHLDPMALRIGGELAAAGFGFRYGSGYKSLCELRSPLSHGGAGNAVLLPFGGLVPSAGRPNHRNVRRRRGIRKAALGQ